MNFRRPGGSLQRYTHAFYKKHGFFHRKGTRDFENSPPFERSAYFYVTVTGNSEHFQYYNFEINFLENENLFQKTVVFFFS